LLDHAAPSLPQKQKSIVQQAFDCGAIKLLADNMSSDRPHKDIVIKQAVKKLDDAYGTAQDTAERVIWEFTNALGWGLPELKNQLSAKLAPPPSPTTQPVTTAPYSPTPSIDALMTRAWMFLGDSDWKEAADYFNRVLDITPSYAQAFLGLLCVDLKVLKEDSLEQVKDPNSIAGHKYYKRAISDAAIKAQLEGYVQVINVRNEHERKATEEATQRKQILNSFDNAVKIMKNAKSSEDYQRAITAFSSIDSIYYQDINDSFYQDINSQIKDSIHECELRFENSKIKKAKEQQHIEQYRRIEEQQNSEKERIRLEQKKEEERKKKLESVINYALLVASNVSIVASNVFLFQSSFPKQAGNYIILLIGIPTLVFIGILKKPRKAIISLILGILFYGWLLFLSVDNYNMYDTDAIPIIVYSSCSILAYVLAFCRHAK
jgi:hypothetical protein